METWWPMCGSPAVGNLSSPALSSGSDEAIVTGAVVTITPSHRGVGNTTATLKLGVAPAAPEKVGACPGSDIGLPNLGINLGPHNRSHYDLADGVEGHRRLKQAMVTDRRLVADISLDPATRRRRLG